MTPLIEGTPTKAKEEPFPYCPCSKMRNLGDLLITAPPTPSKKKQKNQESLVVFTLKQDLYWLQY